MRITGLVYRLSHDTHLLDKDRDISTAYYRFPSGDSVYLPSGTIWTPRGC